MLIHYIVIHPVFFSFSGVLQCKRRRGNEKSSFSSSHLELSNAEMRFSLLLGWDSVSSTGIARRASLARDATREILSIGITNC